MHREGVTLAVSAGGPYVRLLDARSAGLDETGLRAAARGLTGATGRLHASRSYRYPYALVSWHAHPVGIDIERIEPCDPAFAASICTPAETIKWSSLSDPHEYFIAMWSSKEALAKALGNALDYDPRRLQAPMLWPHGRAGVWRAADLHTPDDHVAWVCWQSADRSSRAAAPGGGGQAREP
jgi:phosphopantetheinyl transferase